MYALHILTGPWKGKRLIVREHDLRIGRDETCGLRLPDDELSREHAVIQERMDGVRIRDLGSLNGILVNEQPTRETRLEDGMILELGRTRIQFRAAPVATGSVRRRVGLLEVLAPVAVALVLLFQLVFLLGLTTRSRTLLQWAERLTKLRGRIGHEPERAPDPFFEEAEAHLKKLAAPPAADLGAPSVGAQPSGETEAAPAAVKKRTAETPAAEAMAFEIARLRADVEDLRREVEQRAPPSIADTGPVGRAEAAMDPLERRAREMLEAAALEIQRHNLLEADELLGRIQIMAPSFLPAYIERAKLYEQRGLLHKAGEQWAEVLRRSVGTPLYEHAAAERIRVARAQLLPPAPPPEASGGARRLPRRIRILSIEQEKMPGTEHYEEMRLLRITLRPVASERTFDPEDVRVRVVFFDEDLLSKEIAPTRTVGSRSLLRLDGTWLPGDQKSVTATYLVPSGFRAADEQKTGRRTRYYGYGVQVFYREELQDEDARPKALLDNLRALPSPFHAAPPSPR